MPALRVVLAFLCVGRFLFLRFGYETAFRLIHKRPGPACCENARYGFVTSQQRDGPVRAIVDKSRIGAACVRSPAFVFCAARMFGHC
jgi:hypothetical protein